MTNWIDLQALWRIVLVGLICGAGLPALFAVGLRLLVPATPSGRATVVVHTRVVTAGLCFAAVLAAIGAGIYLIVAG